MIKKNSIEFWILLCIFFLKSEPGIFPNLCAMFWGTYCNNQPALDMLIIFDGTAGTEEFNTFKEELAQSISENFPRNNSRIAILEYAITSTIVLNFDFNLGVSDWTQAILEMEPSGIFLFFHIENIFKIKDCSKFKMFWKPLKVFVQYTCQTFQISKIFLISFCHNYLTQGRKIRDFQLNFNKTHTWWKFLMWGVAFEKIKLSRKSGYIFHVFLYWKKSQHCQSNLYLYFISKNLRPIISNHSTCTLYQIILHVLWKSKILLSVPNFLFCAKLIIFGEFTMHIWDKIFQTSNFLC